jgi:hypothetical protein
MKCTSDIVRLHWGAWRVNFTAVLQVRCVFERTSEEQLLGLACGAFFDA